VPEGPTIHRHARQHTRWFAGGPVAVSSPQGRFAGATVVDGARFVAANAYGKHLFHRYDTGATVHVHLGLFGRILRHDAPPPEPRDTVRMRVANTSHAIDLIGAIACEVLDPDAVDAIGAGLGPDPLRRDADPDRGWAVLQRRKVNIGRALMDQAVIAGVGNVYRAEVLHVLGIHPETPSAAIDHDTWCAIWAQLSAWMRRAVRSGRLVTVDDAPPRAPRHAIHHVYRRDTCRSCGDDVRRWDLADRWAYACETCQERV
jgi:endonuclease VIII